MTNENGRVQIVFNGEFYNFMSYRPELLSHHAFRSKTDTEVVLHLFEECGIEKTLTLMNGMFAFAIWDSVAQCLILARDRLGKKPLYYLLMPNGSLLFASEIKGLLATGLIDRQKIDPVALVQFWTYGYATGARTIFSQIRRILPGHYAVWKDGKLEEKEYWDCPFGGDVYRDKSLDDLADELEALLCDSIRLRLVADVPVGLFLSGGLDSSLIAALTAKIAGVKMNTFTIGFADESFNESAYAQAVSVHLGLYNKVLHVTEDVQPAAGRIARHFDEPFGDSSAIPTWFVAKLAREYVTVALTGDGGDELFAGYNVYVKALSLWGNPEQRRLFADAKTLLERLVDFRMRLVREDRRLTVLEMMMSPRQLRRILSDEIWKLLSGSNPYEDRERWNSRVASADLLSRLQYMNLKTYLPDDVLVKVDRTSMAWSLECRCPLLDYRIVEFAAHLPYFAKIDAHGRQKAILRRILHRYVPAHLFDRPKMGFSVPWSQWCQGPLGDRLKEQWVRMTNPYHRPAAAARLFPAHKLGRASQQWNAYCVLQFFDELTGSSN